MTSATHIPVMLERCVEILGPALERPGAVVLDATLGLGGHSEAFLQRFPEARLIGLDRDPQALEASGRRLRRSASVQRWCTRCTTRSRRCSRA